MKVGKKRNRIARIFSKKELKMIYDRLVAGDATALAIWCSYFEVMARISAGKAINDAYRNHDDKFNERYHDGWLTAQSVGADVLSGKLKIHGEPENYTWKAIKNAIKREDKSDRIWLQNHKQVEVTDESRSHSTEVEMNTRTKREMEEVLACCYNDFQRDLIAMIVDDKVTVKEAAERAGCEIWKARNELGVVADRLAKRKEEQGEPDRQLRKAAKRLKGVRKPSPKQANAWPAEKPVKGRPVKV